MRIKMMKRLFILVFSLLTFHSQAASSQLHIQLINIQPRVGDFKLAVYQGKENWMRPDKAVLKRRIKRQGADQQTITLPLLPGEYAISIVHDENDNDRMDMSWFPYPHPGEGVGVSNNVESMGPPDYDDARFLFQQDGQHISIKMRYF